MKTGVTLESLTDVKLKNLDVDSMFCIWLVDDDAYCRQHLTWLLNAEPDINCSRCFSSASSLLAEFRQWPRPDAILMDLEMPFMNGIEAIAPIKRVMPSAMIAILATFFDHRRKEEALALGAADFVLKRGLSSQIIAVIRAVSVRFNSFRHAHVLAPQ